MAALAVGFIAIVVAMPSSHTPIASRWNYNEHLFPIFRDRCGGCHNDGGIAPMSLVDYQQAYPWTQSIREEVLGLRMPPWQAEDGFGSFRNGHALTVRELDMILEWSSGGYPQGPLDQAPPVPDFATGWSLGEPTVGLELPEPYVLDAGTNETVRYFVLPVDVEDERWITAVDFQPGERSVVRGAALFVDTTGRARTLDDAAAGLGFAQPEGQVFPTTPPAAVWMPGQEPVVNDGIGHRLPEGADVILRIHYKKTWITEGQAFSDRSRVGLYLSDTADEIVSMLVASPATVSGREVTFAHEITQDVTLVALFPEVDIETSEMQIEAIRPDGSRVPMLWLREPDAGWPTRFWLEAPVNLPQGSQLEVTAVLDPGAEHSPRSSLLGFDVDAPIRFAVDYVPGSSAAN